ncbi:hypothetical protein NQD34_014319, partial [Periophthalmus magnuspinnatus]
VFRAESEGREQRFTKRTVEIVDQLEATRQNLKEGQDALLPVQVHCHCALSIFTVASPSDSSWDNLAFIIMPGYVIPGGAVQSPGEAVAAKHTVLIFSFSLDPSISH